MCLTPLRLLQHKLGGDRFEAFRAVPVNPQNRLKADGKSREIEVADHFHDLV